MDGSSQTVQLMRGWVGVVNSVFVRCKALPPAGESPKKSSWRGGTFSLFPSPSMSDKEVLARFAHGLGSGVAEGRSMSSGAVVGDDVDSMCT